MAYQFQKWAWDVAGTLNLESSERLVLLALADRANGGTRQCWPRQRTLAAQTGLNVATVRRALKALEEHGLIERERRNNARGHRTSDLIQVLIPTARETLSKGASRAGIGTSNRTSQMSSPKEEDIFLGDTGASVSQTTAPQPPALNGQDEPGTKALASVTLPRGVPPYDVWLADNPDAANSDNYSPREQWVMEKRGVEFGDEAGLSAALAAEAGS